MFQSTVAWLAVAAIVCGSLVAQAQSEPLATDLAVAPGDPVLVLVVPGDVDAATSSAMREAARSELASQHGATGLRVRLTVEADQCSAVGGRALASRLAAADGGVPRLALVVGHPCAAAAIEAAAIYARADVLFIAAGPTHARVTRPRTGPTIFRLPGSGPPPGAVIGAALAKSAQNGPIALVHDRTLQSRTFIDEVRAGLPSDTVIAAIETYAGGDKDFATLATRIKASGARALAIGGFPVEALALIGELRAQGFDGAIGGGESLNVPEFGGHASAAGVIVPMLRGGPDTAIRAAAATRAAIAIWAEARRTAATSNPEAIAAALATGAFARDGTTIRFDADGNGSLPIYKALRWTPAGLADVL